MYRQFNIQQFYVLPSHCIYAFCVDIRTNSDYFPLQNWLVFVKRFNPLQPSGHYMYRQFNIQQFYVLPTHCIYAFCVDIRTNSNYFPLQNWLVFIKRFNPLQPSGHYMYRQFNIQQFYVLPTHCISMFCVAIRTNSDYFPLQNWLVFVKGFNPLRPSGHYMYRHFNIQQFYVLPTQFIYVFCVDLRTNSHYFPIHY